MNDAHETSLLTALMAQDYDMTRFLLMHGASLHKIWFALAYGTGSYLQGASTALLRLLIEHGLPVHGNDAGHNALYWACSSGKVEMVLYLLTRGENPNQKLFNGKTPLRCAQEANQKAVVKLLLQKGARYATYSVRGKVQRSMKVASPPSLDGSLASPP